MTQDELTQNLLSYIRDLRYCYPQCKFKEVEDNVIQPILDIFHQIPDGISQIFNKVENPAKSPLIGMLIALRGVTIKSLHPEPSPNITLPEKSLCALIDYTIINPFVVNDFFLSLGNLIKIITCFCTNEKHLMTLFKCGLFDLVVTCDVVITNDIRNDLSRNVQNEICCLMSELFICFHKYTEKHPFCLQTFEEKNLLMIEKNNNNTIKPVAPWKKKKTEVKNKSHEINIPLDPRIKKKIDEKKSAIDVPLDPRIKKKTKENNSIKISPPWQKKKIDKKKLAKPPPWQKTKIKERKISIPTKQAPWNKKKNNEENKENGKKLAPWKKKKTEDKDKPKLPKSPPWAKKKIENDNKSKPIKSAPWEKKKSSSKTVSESISSVDTFEEKEKIAPWLKKNPGSSPIKKKRKRKDNKGNDKKVKKRKICPMEKKKNKKTFVQYTQEFLEDETLMLKLSQCLEYTPFLSGQYICCCKGLSHILINSHSCKFIGMENIIRVIEISFKKIQTYLAEESIFSNSSILLTGEILTQKELKSRMCVHSIYETLALFQHVMELKCKEKQIIEFFIEHGFLEILTKLTTILVKNVQLNTLGKCFYLLEISIPLIKKFAQFVPLRVYLNKKLPQLKTCLCKLLQNSPSQLMVGQYSSFCIKDVFVPSAEALILLLRHDTNCNVNLENLFTSVYQWTSRNHNNNICDKENCFLIRPFAELLCDIYPRCQRPHLLGILGKILNDICTHRCEELLILWCKCLIMLHKISPDVLQNCELNYHPIVTLLHDHAIILPIQLQSTLSYCLQFCLPEKQFKRLHLKHPPINEMTKLLIPDLFSS